MEKRARDFGWEHKNSRNRIENNREGDTEHNKIFKFTFRKWFAIGVQLGLGIATLSVKVHTIRHAKERLA